MKIPNDGNLSNEYLQEVLSAYERAAAQLTLRYNVFVEVISKNYHGATTWTMNPRRHSLHNTELIFKVLDREFNTPKDVRKFLKLKAFL